ncbi:LysR family transcriptional regulator [Burkholderia sp. Ac-20365]|jgi:DNA-binding transcriptional LysR family regulator|uniref:LysR family transcriptional regulator n=1 Tax=Burkholderia sp. Ac-20365 TaxID=2703897 RepID=UPI00197C64D8|nr:LysR family transcriptional regulator [Burkholderia sp. Ac-20365]MBN3762087.1 LysR family transcriptional regulator [Burkholderia sp. Ac-20365]
MNKFVDMATFVSVVDASSFSEAARRLGTTKSIVSTRIRQLERRLGCALLERDRPLRVTLAGGVFYESASRVLHDVRLAEESVQDAQCSLRGPLRISVPLALLARYLGPILSAFADRHAELQLDIDTQDRAISMQDGQYDVMIHTGELPDSSLVARTITTYHSLICASPAYLDRYDIPRHPRDLANHFGVNYYNREPNGMWSLLVDGKRQSFRVRTRLRADSEHMLLEGARAGLGLAILPTFIAGDFLLSGDLIAVLQDYAPQGGQLSVVYRKAVRTPPKINALIEFLSAHIGDPANWDAPLISAGVVASQAVSYKAASGSFNASAL